jgi:hypothetical protein
MDKDGEHDKVLVNKAKEHAIASQERRNPSADII